MCEHTLKAGVKDGVIRERPEPTRINVEDEAWLELPADVKDRVLQAVACDVWHRAAPSGLDSVEAYGYRSGKRLQMFTSAGMVRD